MELLQKIHCMWKRGQGKPATPAPPCQETVNQRQREMSKEGGFQVVSVGCVL